MVRCLLCESQAPTDQLAVSGPSLSLSVLPGHRHLHWYWGDTPVAKADLLMFQVIMKYVVRMVRYHCGGVLARAYINLQSEIAPIDNKCIYIHKAVLVSDFRLPFLLPSAKINETSPPDWCKRSEH